MAEKDVALKRPRIVMMAGLPGSGKSTLARALAAHLNGVVLDKDIVRAALFPEKWLEYSQQQDDFCVDVLLDAAAYLARLPAPPSYLFLDGRTFAAKYQIDRVMNRASQINCPVSVIHTVCSDQSAEKRLALPHIAKNRDFALYLKRKAEFEEIIYPHVVINTDQSLETCFEQGLHYLVIPPISPA